MLRESTTLFLPESYARNDNISRQLDNITEWTGGVTKHEARGEWIEGARKKHSDRLHIVTWWHALDASAVVQSCIEGLVRSLLDLGEVSVAVETRRVYNGNQVTTLRFFAEGDEVILN